MMINFSSYRAYKSLVICVLFSMQASSALSQIPAGQFLWLRSDTGVNLSGNTIRSWADNAHNFILSQTDESHQPRLIQNGIGSYPIVRFEGYQYLEGPAVFPANKSYTISVVINITDTLGYNNIVSGDHHAFWLN